MEGDDLARRGDFARVRRGWRHVDHSQHPKVFIAGNGTAAWAILPENQALFRSHGQIQHR
jgi:hypothetical protein